MYKPIPPRFPTSAFAPSSIINLGQVDIIYQVGSKHLQEHLKSFCDLENTVKITKFSSSLWLVIIIYTSFYD